MKIAALMLALCAAASAQSPQIPVTGNLGAGGSFPLIYPRTITLNSDANYTMAYPDMAGTGGIIDVKSTVPLTATRNIIAPSVFGLGWTIENATTGGQAIQIIGQTGAGVTIPNGATVSAWYDGAKFTATPIITQTGTLGTSSQVSAFPGSVTAGLSLPSGAPSGAVSANCVWSSSMYVNALCLGIKNDGVTDDTTAIQNAINNYNGRTIYFPCGVYVTSSPITLKSYTHLVGDAFGAYGSCVTEFYNNSSNMFTADSSSAGGTQFTLVEEIMFEMGSSGGHAFNSSGSDGGYNQNRWLNDAWILKGTSSSAISVTGSGEYIQNVVQGFDAWTEHGTTVPVFNLQGTESNGYSDNTFQDGRVSVNGGVGTAPAFYIANNASTESSGELIRNVVIEEFPAGGITFAGIYNSEIDNVEFADVAAGSGTASTIVLTTEGGSTTCNAIIIKNVYANQGNGSTAYDLVTNSSQHVVVLDSYLGAISGNAVLFGKPPVNTVSGTNLIQLGSGSFGVSSSVPTGTAGTGGTSIASQAYADTSSSNAVANILTSSPYFYTPEGGFGTWQNMFPYSETIGTGWTIGGGATVTNNNSVAPDGSTTAAQIVTASSGNVGVVASKNTGTTLSGAYTCSFWLSASTVQAVIMILSSDTSDQYFTKNITTTSTLTRYSITGTFSTTTRPVVVCGVQNTSTNYSKTINLWGMQVELGSVATQYTRTTGTPTSLSAHSYGLRAPYYTFDTLSSASNCSSSASPAVCASAPSGSVVVAASTTTVVVDTTVVTANSQIFVQEDSSLGTKLGVTCNTTPATAPPTISARSAGTSFTITTTSPTTNPRCFSYQVVN